MLLNSHFSDDIVLFHHRVPQISKLRLLPLLQSMSSLRHVPSYHFWQVLPNELLSSYYVYISICNGYETSLFAHNAIHYII